VPVFDKEFLRWLFHVIDFLTLGKIPSEHTTLRNLKVQLSVAIVVTLGCHIPFVPLAGLMAIAL